MGLVGATAVGIGAIVGGGILVLAGVAFKTSGPAAIVAFALNGVIAVITAMSFAEMSTAFPESGGAYTFAKEGAQRPRGLRRGLGVVVRVHRRRRLVCLRLRLLRASADPAHLGVVRAPTGVAQRSQRGGGAGGHPHDFLYGISDP